MKDIQNKIKQMGESKTFRGFLYGVGAMLLALVIFQAGVAVGFHKAEFSSRRGDNYFKVFGKGSGNSMMRMMGKPGEFGDAHGAIGKIISLNLPELTVLGPDGERVVVIMNDTTVLKFMDKIQPQELEVDDFIVVIGLPNEEGKVEAKLIRLAPVPPEDVFFNEKLPSTPE